MESVSNEERKALEVHWLRNCLVLVMAIAATFESIHFSYFCLANCLYSIYKGMCSHHQWDFLEGGRGIIKTQWRRRKKWMQTSMIPSHCRRVWCHNNKHRVATSVSSLKQSHKICVISGNVNEARKCAYVQIAHVIARNSQKSSFLSVSLFIYSDPLIDWWKMKLLFGFLCDVQWNCWTIIIRRQNMTLVRWHCSGFH